MMKMRFLTGLAAVCTVMLVAMPRASVAATFTVTTVADSGAGSLRQAILDANANPGADAITIGVTGRIELAAPLPPVSEALVISGPGAASLTIDGNGLGSVLVSTASLTISGLTVTGGGGTAFGGGINATVLSMTDVVISGNSTTAFGGGVFVSGQMTIVNSTIAGNHSDAFAGGLFIQTGPGTVSNTTISGNTSDSFAGGVYLQGGSGATFVNVTLSGNSANLGGGMYVQAAPTTIVNSTFTGNQGSGASIRSQTASVIVSLLNTVLANTTTANCDGTFTSLGNNLDDDGSCGLNASGDRNNVDPLLGPLANNGGPTATHALLPGSPAIDHANNTGCPSTDQRGVFRPQDGNGDQLAVCDIGAFEVQLPQERAVRPNVGGAIGAIAAAASQSAARNRAAVAAAAPQPAVVPPSTGTGIITPPNTGDGGLR